MGDTAIVSGNMRTQMKLCFECNARKFIVHMNEILYFESHLRKLSVETISKKYEVYKKLDEIEAMELPDFIRCHQSYYVNLRYVKSIYEKKFEMTNDTVIPIAQKRFSAVRKAFSDYIENREDMLIL